MQVRLRIRKPWKKLKRRRRGHQRGGMGLGNVDGGSGADATTIHAKCRIVHSSPKLLREVCTHVCRAARFALSLHADLGRCTSTPATEITKRSSKLGSPFVGNATNVGASLTLAVGPTLILLLLRYAHRWTVAYSPRHLSVSEHRSVAAQRRKLSFGRGWSPFQISASVVTYGFERCFSTVTFTFGTSM